MHRLPLVTIALSLTLATTAGCRRTPDEQLVRFALNVVDAARSPVGLPASLVDEELVEKIRCVQLVKRTTMDTWDPQKLLAVYHGDGGPDRQYPPSERPQKQRERASRGLRAALDGPCTAKAWPEGLKGRVTFLSERPAAGQLPEEIASGFKALGDRLRDAETARVTCQKGEVGFLVVKDAAGNRKLVDAFGLVKSNVEVNPNEPTMK